jgi:hypothetical protein
MLKNPSPGQFTKRQMVKKVNFLVETMEPITLPRLLKSCFTDGLNQF